MTSFATVRLNLEFGHGIFTEGFKVAIPDAGTLLCAPITMRAPGSDFYQIIRQRSLIHVSENRSVFPGDEIVTSDIEIPNPNEGYRHANLVVIGRDRENAERQLEWTVDQLGLYRKAHPYNTDQEDLAQKFLGAGVVAYIRFVKL